MDTMNVSKILQKILALASLALLLGALACLPPTRTDYSPDDDDDDDDDSAESSECASDEVIDCLGGCTPANLLANGTCDEALDCVEHIYDQGDCLLED